MKTNKLISDEIQEINSNEVFNSGESDLSEDIAKINTFDPTQKQLDGKSTKQNNTKINKSKTIRKPKRKPKKRQKRNSQVKVSPMIHQMSDGKQFKHSDFFMSGRTYYIFLRRLVQMGFVSKQNRGRSTITKWNKKFDIKSTKDPQIIALFELIKTSRLFTINQLVQGLKEKQPIDIVGVNAILNILEAVGWVQRRDSDCRVVVWEIADMFGNLNDGIKEKSQRLEPKEELEIHQKCEESENEEENQEKGSKFQKLMAFVQKGKAFRYTGHPPLNLSVSHFRMSCFALCGFGLLRLVEDQCEEKLIWTGVVKIEANNTASTKGYHFIKFWAGVIFRHCEKGLPATTENILDVLFPKRTAWQQIKMCKVIKVMEELGWLKKTGGSNYIPVTWHKTEKFGIV